MLDELLVWLVSNVHCVSLVKQWLVICWCSVSLLSMKDLRDKRSDILPCLGVLMMSLASYIQIGQSHDENKIQMGRMRLKILSCLGTGLVEWSLVYSWCVYFHYFPDGHGCIGRARQGKFHLHSLFCTIYSYKKKREYSISYLKRYATLQDVNQYMNSINWYHQESSLLIY